MKRGMLKKNHILASHQHVLIKPLLESFPDREPSAFKGLTDSTMTKMYNCTYTRLLDSKI